MRIGILTPWGRSLEEGTRTHSDATSILLKLDNEPHAEMSMGIPDLGIADKHPHTQHLFCVYVLLICQALGGA